MARRYEDQLAVVGVAGRDSTTNMAGFVERYDLHHVPHIDDEDGSVWARFGIAGQPSWVFIDGDTGERQTLTGPLGEERLTEIVDELTS